MDLSIIIVNFNTKKLLKTCLTSVFNSLKGEKLKVEIFIVDNGSTDGSVEMIKKFIKEYSHQFVRRSKISLKKRSNRDRQIRVNSRAPTLRLIENRTNLGFAQANNQALQQAQGKIVLLLNSDTRILNKALSKAFQKIKREKDIAALGVKLIDKNSQVQQSAGFVPGLVNLFFWACFLDDLPLIENLIRPYQVSNKKFYQKEQKVGWLTAAFLMVKKDVFDNIGLLDENIFMYGEEVEWFLRFKKAGYQARYTPKFSIYHLGKGSSKENEAKAILGEFKSLKYIFSKHKGKVSRVILPLVLKLGALLRFFIFGTILSDPVKRRTYEKAFNMA